jgi:hypothetical protein
VAPEPRKQLVTLNMTRNVTVQRVSSVLEEVLLNEEDMSFTTKARNDHNLDDIQKTATKYQQQSCRSVSAHK